MLTGTQLRLLRQAKGLMQKDLASKMNIAQQRLSALEREEKISDRCTDRALAALNFTKEEAIRFINILPGIEFVKPNH